MILLGNILYCFRFHFLKIQVFYFYAGLYSFAVAFLSEKYGTTAIFSLLNSGRVVIKLGKLTEK